jgi:hypothetical protein
VVGKRHAAMPMLHMHVNALITPAHYIEASHFLTTVKFDAQQLATQNLLSIPTIWTTTPLRFAGFF